MQRPFGILIDIWPRTVICWRNYSGDLQGLLKGITGQHPVCPRCCMILAGVTLKTVSRDLRLALLYKIVTGHVAINPDQIGLVAADNRTRANHRYKFRAIGASSTEQSVIGTSSLLLLLSRRIQLPSKLSWPDVRLFACHSPPQPLA